MEDKRNKGIGLVGTIAFHALLIGLLIFAGFTRIEPQDEEGILVMVGTAEGLDTGRPSQPDPSPVQPEPQPEVIPEAPSAPEVKEEIVTQDTEESLRLAEAKKKEQQEKERIRKEEERKRKEEAERKRLEEEKKKKEAAIKNKVANVFQNASKTGTQGSATEGTASKGSPQGNSDTGATSGSPGYGSYDLGGRGLRGSLPRPSFSVNESGKVVVNITVDESGKVINAIVGRGTTTTSAELRNRAMEAARKALFETKSGVTTQSGTITYYFDSDN
ncbi:MAG: TonB family protein [Bacteroidales bacterium]